MSPIITTEDELELAKSEKSLAKKIKDLASAQKTVMDSQRKLADNVSKMTIVRESLNKTFRDVLKQMQTLAREQRSNIKDEEVEIYYGIITKNDEYIKSGKVWLNAIKDLTVRKEYYIEKKK